MCKAVNMVVTPHTLILSQYPPLCVHCVLSRFIHVRVFATLWTVARQAPLPMGLSRWKYCRGLPCPSPGDLPDPGIKRTSPSSPALAGRFSTNSATWEVQLPLYFTIIHFILVSLSLLLRWDMFKTLSS